jgi:hypothetical protein
MVHDDGFDFMEHVVRQKMEADAHALEQRVEAFLQAHPLLGGEDIEIVHIVAPDGISHTFIVRERGRNGLTEEGR